MAKKKKNEEPITTEYCIKAGDKITDVARKITGHAYMTYRLLEYNGLTMNEINPGTVLKWR